MKILILTPVYPSKNAPVGSTPVVHYFAREWVKDGNDVTVIHLEKRYPFYILLFGRLFEKWLTSKMGYPIRSRKPVAYEEVTDGVKVHHITIRMFWPSSCRYNKKQISKTSESIIRHCEEYGMPDIFVGHWDNPQLEILNNLKLKYPTVKNALVLHSLKRDLRKSYKGELEPLFDRIDIVGFRSQAASNEFRTRYFNPNHSFIAYSGISSDFFNAYEEKSFENGVRKYIYVGTLIERKHPVEVLEAVSKVYGKDEYSLTYIGDGNERQTIIAKKKEVSDNGKLILTGRMDRGRVIEYLKESDVFVMISSNETFGLVYLESMSMGCITVASIGGGADGIIENGIDGFLCKPGDSSNLAELIEHIRGLSKEELKQISRNAVSKAKRYSDMSVAKDYLNAITFKS